MVDYDEFEEEEDDEDYDYSKDPDLMNKHDQETRDFFEGK